MNQPSARTSLVLSVVYWVTPPLLLVTLFYRGLWCWFSTDDIGLLHLVTLPDDQFWSKLWEPRGQGTFRPLSERLFAFYFYRWFGLNAFPYRVLVFATQIVNLWLLTVIARRLTGMRWAGFAAACLWAVHHSLSSSMTWTSVYNQVLVSTFLLVSFWLFLQFVDTGRWRYYVAQWITFVVGFGALESIVVYPGILLAYTVLVARRYWLHVLPLFLGSAALAWLQLKNAPPITDGAYRMVFDLSILDALWTYTRWALVGKLPAWAALVAGIPLLVFAGYRAYRRDLLGVFFFAWYLAALSPYLPLTHHLTEYYLVVPTIGLLMLGGWAFVVAWRASLMHGLLAVALAALFCYGSVEHSRRNVNYVHYWSNAVKHLVADVATARARHPGRTIMLANVPQELFDRAVYQNIFRLVGIFDVYMTPESRELKIPSGGYRPIEEYILTPNDTLAGLRRGTIVVYDASRGRLTNITRQYTQLAPLRFRGVE